jgi:inosine-uridine nucleoside N-ribohydrolase
MNKIPVILDCDTGVDDAIAIMLINKIKKFDVQCITTVAGNVEVDKTTLNTLRVLQLIDAEIPVFKGAAQPMFRAQITAEEVHGQDGLGGVDLPIVNTKIEDLPAWDAIYQEACNWKGALELITIGPLTNLGMAFIKYRDLPKRIKRVVVMGGSATSGNVTPAAEFNIYADPEAADIVFNSGVPVYMCGLDVTNQAYYTAEELEHITTLGSKPAKFFSEVLQGALAYSLKFGCPGVSLHDPMTVLYAEDDAIFETHQVGIRVETKGHLTSGKTVTDLYSDKKMPHNAYIVTNLDRGRFQNRVFSLMSEYS